jgi:8-hydroxy-5-deazaflavin:NADPH oxidoreductase
MKVTIVGAGNMGRGIGTRLVAGGNDVELVDRDPAEGRALADELQAAAKSGASATALEPDSPFGGEVVVLAIYYPSLAEAVAQYADRLAGKVVVEISNPIDFTTFDGLVTPADSSAAEEVAELVPEGTPVVKAFNTTFGRTLVAGEAGGEQLDVFVAGDDPDAKRKVIALVEAGGLRPIDAGPLRRARQLEHLGFLHIVLQEPLGAGFGSALKLHW